MIDALASRGIVFDSLFTTSSTTLPAHTSLMTGRNPGDLRNGTTLTDSVLTLAEVLSREGYETRAVVSSVPLDEGFNLDQGFDFYDSDFSACRGTIRSRDGTYYARPFGVFDCNASETTQRVLGAIADADHSRPNLLWVHYFDPHFPYQPPERFYDASRVTRRRFPFFHRATKADVTSLNELYDGEVRFVDEQLAKLFEGLEERGFLENALILLVSDHGENLYQHDGYLDHSKVVYETVMKIPALLVLPDGTASRLGQLASITDLMPTLLDLIGVEMPQEGAADFIAGRSLLPMIDAGHTADEIREFVACETNDYGLAKQDQTVAIRSQEFKLILNNWNKGGRTFFDLSEDPQERRPRAELPSDGEAELEGYHQTWISQPAGPPMVKSIELDESTRRGLKSLGYLRDG